MTKCSVDGTAVCNGSGLHKLTPVFEGIGKGLPGCIIRLSACNAKTNADCGWAWCTGVLQTFSPGTTGFEGTARGVQVPRTSNSGIRDIQVHTTSGCGGTT